MRCCLLVIASPLTTNNEPEQANCWGIYSTRVGAGQGNWSIVGRRGWSNPRRLLSMANNRRRSLKNAGLVSWD